MSLNQDKKSPRRKYHNHSNIFRAKHNKDNPYLTVTQRIFKDNRLNALHIGILLILLSNSDEYVINKSVLQRRSGTGRITFEKHWEELKKYGYIIMTRQQSGVIYSIFEDPESQLKPVSNTTGSCSNDTANTTGFNHIEIKHIESSTTDFNNTESEHLITNNEEQSITHKEETIGQQQSIVTNDPNPYQGSFSSAQWAVEVGENKKPYFFPSDFNDFTDEEWDEYERLKYESIQAQDSIADREGN